MVISRAQWDQDGGWVVREGPFLAWYAESDWPRGTTAEEVLWSHIGRRLLYLEREESNDPPSSGEVSGPNDEVLLNALEHQEETEPGAPKDGEVWNVVWAWRPSWAELPVPWPLGETIPLRWKH